MFLTRGYILAFDALVFLSILLSILTVIPPLFSRHVQRRKTWHTFMLAMLGFSVGQSLLVGHQSGELPSTTLCLIQAAVNYATCPLSASAVATYTADIYLSIRSMFEDGIWDGPEPRNVVMLALLPWAVFFLVFIEATATMASSIDKIIPSATGSINRPELYCRTRGPETYLVSAICVVLAGLVIIVYEIATGWLLYKNWIKVKNLGLTSTIRRFIQAFLRTVAFTVIAILGLSLSITATFSSTEPDYGPAVVLAIVPIISSLIFGSYRDILSFYAFWRQQPASLLLD